jgi:CheY-like chemotaxis protein
MAKKKLIAVIDDEHKWLNVYKRMFRKSSYGIDTYSDPQVFLDTIEKYPQKFAGIICDIKMPVLSGHQVFERVKNNKKTQDVPFLIVSGVLTQDQNLSRVQAAAYVSKMDDKLRERIFDELIEVIENWPRVKQYLRSQYVSEDEIEFFCQFFINYQKFFNEILTYVNHMEQAFTRHDDKAIALIKKECTDFMSMLHDKCMGIVSILQECPETINFFSKLCTRSRSSLAMIQNFQILLSEDTVSNNEFHDFLDECRQSLEKIIIGTGKGYNLREY